MTAPQQESWNTRWTREHAFVLKAVTVTVVVVGVCLCVWLAI